MKKQGFIACKNIINDQQFSGIPSSLHQKIIQKDSISIRSNMGSIQSSLKGDNLASKLLSQKYTKNQCISDAASNKKSNSSKMQDKQVYEWQAVYIDGKFYLTDKQTIKRYYQIEALLQMEKKAKEKFGKTENIKGQVRGLNNGLENGLENQRKKRIQNLQTIKLVDRSQSEREKQEDESLLNNLDTSSQSRFTLNYQNQEQSSANNQQPNHLTRIDSISSIGKEPRQIIDQKAIETQNNQQLLQPNQVKVQNSLRTLSQKKSQPHDKKDTKYGYYLSITGQKIFSKQDEDQKVQELKSFEEPNQNESMVSLQSPSQNPSHKTLSLQQQGTIQLPIDFDTNRLKISDKMSSISSVKQRKVNNLPRITEEKEQQPKRQQSFVNGFSKVMIPENKNFRSLPQQNPTKIRPQPTKTLYKKFSQVHVRPFQSTFSNTIFTNNQNVNLVQPNNEQESIEQPQQKYKLSSMNVNDLLDKLTSLKSDKKPQTQRVKARSNHREKFIDMMKNNQFDFTKKYELPQIMTKNDQSMIKSHQKTKKQSIEEKYQLAQKEQQNQLFFQAQQQALIRSNLLNSKTRLAGFIKTVKGSDRKFRSALDFQQSFVKDQQIQQFKPFMNDNGSSISQRSKSKKKRSLFVTRNYDTKSIKSNRKQNHCEQQVNFSSKQKSIQKSSKSIGKIVSREQSGILDKKNVQNNKDHFQKKDIAVETNLSKLQNDLHDKIRSLRNKKDQLMQKLQEMQKQKLQLQINQIKRQIREIQIKKLNKMSKTIDLTQQNPEQPYQIHQNSQTFKKRRQKIHNLSPSTFQEITSPSHIAPIKIPQQLIHQNSTYILSQKMTSQQLQQLAIRVYKLFGIDHDPNYRAPSLLTTFQKPELSLKQKEKLVIKKYKNCVMFDIVGERAEGKKIVWNFQDLNEKSSQKQSNRRHQFMFYIGGWSKASILNQDRSKSKHPVTSHGKKNGFGLEINQKFIYQGQFLEGKRHGYGKIHLVQSNYRYQGQFISNHKSGHGQQFIPSKNEVYFGQFKDDKRHGKGYIKKILLKQNKRRSPQKDCQRKERLMYFFSGTFINGQKQAGYELFQSGDEYKGEYSHQMFHGKGVYTWVNGAQYDGEFAQNKRHGFGKWTSQPDKDGNRTFYIGQFNNNLKSGEGKYVYPNGAYYQGAFSNDLKHGLGALFYQDQNQQSKVLRGYWKDGNIVANEKGQIYQMKLEKQSDQVPNFPIFV